MGENPLSPRSAVFKAAPLAVTGDRRAGEACGSQAGEVGM